MTECVFGLAHGSQNGRMISDIKSQGEDAAAEPIEFTGERCKSLLVTAGENQVRTGAREGSRKMLAQSAACPGDQGNLAGKVK